MTKKELFKGAVALMMSLSLFACNKERRALEEKPSLETEIDSETKANLKLYTATSEVADFTFAQEATKEGEEGLRAGFISRGYRAPELYVERAEFQGHKKAHWCISGKGITKINDVKNFLSSLPNKAHMPTVNSLAIYKQGNKTMLKIYSFINSDFDIKNRYAMLSLDGYLDPTSPNLIAFTASTAPNSATLYALNSGEKLRGSVLPSIPIMTDILPAEKVFGDESKRETVHYRPRGIMLTLSLINNLCGAIEVKRIVFDADNALSFEGYFNAIQATDGTNIQSQSSKGSTKTYKAKFTGLNDNKAHSYGIANAYLSSLKIDKELGQTLTMAMKEAASHLYVWGYPRAGKNKLRFTLFFSEYGKRKQMSKSYEIELPKAGLKDGYAYRLPILIKEDKEELFHSMNFRTPLDFVAEMPAINKAGTDLVHNLCVANPTTINELQDSEEGYYSFDDTKTLYTKQWLKDRGYHQPNRFQAQAIFPQYSITRYYKPDYPILIPTNKVLNKDSRTEKAQVGDDVSEQDYTSDYVTVQEGEANHYVTYAHRFKGTKWESAWRYELLPEYFEDQRLSVKCVPLPQNSSLDLVSVIAKPSYFTEKECSLRTFPCYGLSANGGRIYNKHTTSMGWYNWTSTQDETYVVNNAYISSEGNSVQMRYESPRFLMGFLSSGKSNPTKRVATEWVTATTAHKKGEVGQAKPFYSYLFTTCPFRKRMP